MTKDEKQVRLAEALRANLRRRKVQSREQREPAMDGGDGTPRDPEPNKRTSPNE